MIRLRCLPLPVTTAVFATTCTPTTTRACGVVRMRTASMPPAITHLGHVRRVSDSVLWSWRWTAGRVVAVAVGDARVAAVLVGGSGVAAGAILGGVPAGDGTGVLLDGGIGVLVGVGTGVLVLVGTGVLVSVGTSVLVRVGSGVLVLGGGGVLVRVGVAVAVGGTMLSTGN